MPMSTENKKRTPGKRNRAAGHAYELQVVKTFEKIFPHVRTSRSVSRTRDAEKVDLAHVDEHKYGRFPYNVQCKNMCASVAYHKLLRIMPQEEGITNVIFHKYTVKKEFKTGNGSHFATVGEFAITTTRDFMTMVQYKQAYKIMMQYYEFLPQEQQEQLQKQFIEHGLA